MTYFRFITSNTKIQHTILALIISTATLFFLFTTQNSILSALIALIFIFFYGQKIGNYLFKEDKLFNIFWGITTLFAISIIILSAIYWFYSFNQYTVASIILLITLSIFLPSTLTNIKHHIPQTIHNMDWWIEKILLIIFVLLDTVLISVLYSKQFGDTLSSPWTIIGAKFFVAFFLATFILIFITLKKPDSKFYPLLFGAHFFIILNVAAFIFKYGFGFDPFIHEAAEKYINDYGQLFPKQPYYIGQYCLVLLIHFITKFPIELIDKWLVPTLAAVTLPIATYSIFHKLNLGNKLWTSIIFLPILPLSFFIQTTPNNLALFISYLAFLCLISTIKKTNNYFYLLAILLSFAAIVVHPLIGIPTLFICLGYFLSQKISNNLFYFFYTLGIAVLPAILLLANNIKMLRFVNLSFNFKNSLALLEPPYWYIFENASFLWKSLYFYKIALGFILFNLACVGLIILTKKYSWAKTKFIAFTILGLFLSAFIIAVGLNFSNLAAYEQTSYAQRMFSIIKLFELLLLLIFFNEILNKISKNNLQKILIGAFGSIIILISFYFTYPTRDQVSRYTGFTIRDVDIEVVNFIENRNPDSDYIVLTNQAIGAAAIYEFGFKKYFTTKDGEQFFYSIPTGGPLYKFFSKMVYQEPKKKWMEEAMEYAGVKRAYFVHTSYWAPAAEIRDNAKLEADAWWEFGPLRVWVYEYNLEIK